MAYIVARGLGSTLVTEGYAEGYTPSPCPGTMTWVSTTVYPNRVDLTFSGNTLLLGDVADYTQYSITGGTVPVTVTSIEAVGAILRVHTTEPKHGESLTLTIPTMTLKDTSLNIYYGPFSFVYTSVGVAPYIALAASLGGHSLKVIYSEPVVAADALDIANYSIPGLTVLGAAYETDSVYILTTSLQTPGTSYTVTVTNVRDLKNNPV